MKGGKGEERGGDWGGVDWGKEVKWKISSVTERANLPEHSLIICIRQLVRMPHTGTGQVTAKPRKGVWCHGYYGIHHPLRETGSAAGIVRAQSPSGGPNCNSAPGFAFSLPPQLPTALHLYGSHYHQRRSVSFTFIVRHSSLTPFQVSGRFLVSLFVRLVRSILLYRTRRMRC